MSTENQDDGEQNAPIGGVALLRQLAGQSITDESLNRLAKAIWMPADMTVNRESVALSLIEGNMDIMRMMSSWPEDERLYGTDAENALIASLNGLGMLSERVETRSDIVAGFLRLAKFLQTAATAIGDQEVPTYPTLQDYERSRSTDTSS